MADSRLYLAQHKRRLSWMPWLYFSLKPKHRAWAESWQQKVQQRLTDIETVQIAQGCFVAPEARIFAEPGRDVIIGPGCSIAADVFLHGPARLGRNVSLNARVSVEGGSAGVQIGDNTRIATGVAIYAFDHGLEPGRLIREQPVRSKGIRIGADVWIGANACITDGVQIGDGSVVGAGAVVTHDVAPGTIVGGSPARLIRTR